MDDSPTQRDSWDGTPRLTTTRPLKPRGVGPIKVKRPQHRDKTDSATTANTPSEGIDDSPTQRGSWDGAPGPSTTRSLKPRGVDAVKVKRHSTNKTRERHFYHNIPSEGMDDSPTQRGSWDGTPKPTTRGRLNHEELTLSRSRVTHSRDKLGKPCPAELDGALSLRRHFTRDIAEAPWSICSVFDDPDDCYWAWSHRAVFE